MIKTRKADRKKPILKEKEKDMGRFLDWGIEEAEAEFKRRLK